MSLGRSCSGFLALAALVATQAPARADFVVRDVRATWTIDSLEDADALLAGDGILRETTASRPFIDLFDEASRTWEGSGHFSNDLSFPGDIAGERGHDFAIHATASLVINAAGVYTFGINSDDGARLRINAGGGFVTVINDPSVHGPWDHFGAITFDAPGVYDLDLVFFQRGGEATVELFAAAGDFSDFNQTNAWRLVGDTANGGLATLGQPAAVPEPAGLVMLGLGAGALALVARRKRS